MLFSSKPHQISWSQLQDQDVSKAIIKMFFAAAEHGFNFCATLHCLTITFIPSVPTVHTKSLGINFSVVCTMSLTNLVSKH